jgi:hypothetical protein
MGGIAVVVKRGFKIGDLPDLEGRLTGAFAAQDASASVVMVRGMRFATRRARAE